MKRILFVLPLSVLLTYCSSSKQATTPVGVSNVQVNGADYNSANATGSKDWGYKSSRDTAMNGTWELEGMVAADGGWKSAETWTPADTMSMSADVDIQTQMEANKPGPSTDNSSMASSKKSTSTAKGKKFSYKMADTSTHFFDTVAFRQQLAGRELKPFQYWQRLPEMRIMANLGVFTGNTGCNSMSGSFNFNSSKLKIDNNIRTSKMACSDYDESAFISNLLKADSYNVSGDKLELMQGNTTVLTFKRKV